MQFNNLFLHLSIRLKHLFKYSKIFLTIIFISSLLLSIYCSTFYNDMLHREKMFVEANQFLSGLIPYKEVFIMYGYITTVLDAFSLIFFGKYVLSVSIITGIIYALTFPIFFLILKNLKIEKEQSILSIIIIFLVHPYIELPWSNYIAYFFALIGIYYITKQDFLKKNLFLTGLFWSLACLSRQTYFVPLFSCILIIISTKYFLIKKNFFIKHQPFFLLIGFIFPITIFFFYLVYNKIFIYWSYETFNLTEDSFKYVFSFVRDGTSFFSVLFQLIKPYKDFFLAKNLKSFFYLIIIFFNIYILLFFFIKKNFNERIFYIAILSLLMLSQIVHSIDVFRLSTSVVIGFINIIFYMRNNKMFKKCLYFFIFVLVLSWGYYINNSFKLKTNYVYSDLVYFRFIKLPKHIANLYQEFSDIIIDIKSHYIINRNFNYTFIPMLSFLSETQSYQIGTYYELAVEKFYSQIPEFKNLYNSRQDCNDIIIFYLSNNERTINHKFEKNFFLYKSLYLQDGKYIQFLIPKKAKKIKNF